MKKYQFTLTENYVSDWTYIEAIRELLQNAYDYEMKMSVLIQILLL